MLLENFHRTFLAFSSDTRAHTRTTRIRGSRDVLRRHILQIPTPSFPGKTGRQTKKKCIAHYARRIRMPLSLLVFYPPTGSDNILTSRWNLPHHSKPPERRRCGRLAQTESQSDAATTTPDSVCVCVFVSRGIASLPLERFRVVCFVLGGYRVSTAHSPNDRTATVCISSTTRSHKMEDVK